MAVNLQEKNKTGFSLSFKTTSLKQVSIAHKSFNKENNKSINQSITAQNVTVFNDLFNKTEDEKIIPLIQKTKWRTPKEKPPPLEHDHNKNNNDNDDDDIEEKKEEALNMILNENKDDKIILAPNNNNGKTLGAFNQMRMNQVPGTEEIDDAKKKLQIDCAQRPSAPNIDTYSSMPISVFGEAMMKGMGWTNGEPVGNQYGKNKNNLIIPTIINSKPHPKGLGFGATLTTEMAANIINRKFNPHKQLTKKQKEHIKHIQSYTKPKLPPRKKQKIDHDKSKYIDDYSDNHEKRKRKKTKKYKNHKSISWVRNGLKVRVIRKKSEYYKEKGYVDDIIDKYQFCLQMHDDKLLTLYQDEVETVIPKIGQFVVILYGKHKNLRGHILKKHKYEQYATIQLEDNLSIIKCDYDDICAI